MEKKLQIFVSSTYTDLIEERQAAVQAILDAGHIPAGMELFKAGKSQMQTIKKWIDNSDVYLLILGGRYGSIEAESGLSYTQLEYEYAIQKHMPVFSIVLSERFLHMKAAVSGESAVFEKQNADKYELFKSLVLTQIVKEINDISAISGAVIGTLNEFLYDEEYRLSGWVKGTTINNDPQIISRLRFLENENKNLKSRIETPQNKIFGKFTADELIAILSSVKIWDRLVDLAGDIDSEELEQFKDSEFTYANALDYFYALFSFLAIGIPNKIFQTEEMDEVLAAILLSCASILISCDLITMDADNNMQITDTAKKFYAHLLLINYVPSVNLLISLLEYCDIWD